MSQWQSEMPDWWEHSEYWLAVSPAIRGNDDAVHAVTIDADGARFESGPPVPPDWLRGGLWMRRETPTDPFKGANMNILDLDEAQGLTEEMVQTWAEARRWRYRTGGLRTPNGGMAAFIDPRGSVPWIIQMIAAADKRPIQEVLREINPRMRPGVPSDAARDEHPRLWLGNMGGRYPVAQIGYFTTLGGLAWSAGGFSWDLNGPISEKYPPAFWPCDGSGNKLRWPERDGVML